jgi:hypothetical protein
VLTSSQRLALLIFLAAVAQPLAARTTAQFGLLGDTGYSDYGRGQLPLMLQHMGEANLDFAIHDGDIKNGRSRCDDAIYNEVLAVFRAAPMPVVYVPGDNEWTDCRRALCGSFNPEERLDFLRRTFFFDSRSLGQQRIELERQSRQKEFARFVENVRWQAGGAMFVTLNMPGADNNVVHREEFELRNRANLAWLAEGFRIARERKLRGILIAIQANPHIEADNEGAGKPGFKAFLDRLREETADFSGQVVLVHGDTHQMQINRPLKDRRTRQTVENFTRIETYGFPFMGWIRGSVDDSDPKVFRFETHPWPPHPLLR